MSEAVGSLSRWCADRAMFSVSGTLTSSELWTYVNK